MKTKMLIVVLGRTKILQNERWRTKFRILKLLHSSFKIEKT